MGQITKKLQRDINTLMFTMQCVTEELYENPEGAFSRLARAFSELNGLCSMRDHLTNVAVWIEDAWDEINDENSANYKEDVSDLLGAFDIEFVPGLLENVAKSCETLDFITDDIVLKLTVEAANSAMSSHASPSMGA